MARYGEVRPLNLFADYMAGKQAAQDEQSQRQANALRDSQLQRAQNMNALAQNPAATPEQYIRAGDAQTGAALQGVQDRQQADRSQAISQISSIAQKALTLQDPVQRRGFIHQAVQAYAPAFQALGADTGKGLAELEQLPDDQLTQRLQQVAAFAQPRAPISVAPGATLIDPDTKKPVYSAPEAPKDELSKLNSDLKAGLISQSDYDARRNMMTTRATGVSGQGFDDPKIQDLQAAISATGYALPAGFRSQAQQLALMHGLLRKYPGLDANDIAHLLANNAIDYKAVSKSTQVAAGIAGKVEFANNELSAFIPIAQDASAAVDRGNFMPWTRLKQMGERNISDPNLKRLFVATQSILNAYDQLASRGGTDAAKRAENHKILETADSPEAYQAALDMIVKEGQAAGDAARKTIRADAFAPTARTPAPPTAQPEITATGPNGQKLVLRNGQWVPK
jgi:hypothetical protein